MWESKDMPFKTMNPYCSGPGGQADLVLRMRVLDHSGKTHLLNVECSFEEHITGAHEAIAAALAAARGINCATATCQPEPMPAIEAELIQHMGLEQRDDLVIRRLAYNPLRGNGFMRRLKVQNQEIYYCFISPHTVVYSVVGKRD